MALLSLTGADILKVSVRKRYCSMRTKSQTRRISSWGTIFMLMEKLGREAGCVLDLDDILQFPDGAPPWTKECYRPIFFVRKGDSGMRISVHVTWKSGTSPHLGFEPENMLCVGYRVRLRVFLSFSRCSAIVENRTTLERLVLIIQDRIGATDAKEFLTATCCMEGNVCTSLNIFQDWIYKCSLQ